MSPLTDYLYLLTTAQVLIIKSPEGARVHFNASRSLQSFYTRLSEAETRLNDFLRTPTSEKKLAERDLGFVVAQLESELLNFDFTDEKHPKHRYFRLVSAKSEALYAQHRLEIDPLIAEYIHRQHDSLTRMLSCLQGNTILLGQYCWTGRFVHLLELLVLLWNKGFIQPAPGAPTSKHAYCHYIFTLVGIKNHPNIYNCISHLNYRKYGSRFWKQLLKGERVIEGL